ncbi:MAG: carbohydrate ABC transporter permease [Aggregatilineales bacterium]
MDRISQKGLTSVQTVQSDSVVEQARIKRRNKRIRTFILYTFIFIILAAYLFPTYWMVLASFQPNGDLIISPPNLIPKNFTLESYTKIFQNVKIQRYFINSIIVTGSTVFISLLIGVLAGYSFSRFNIPGKNLFFTSILSVQMFPRVAILIVLFTLFTRLKLTDTLYGLTLAHLTLTVPFSVWFMKAFFDAIPIELEEAAFIDGAGRLTTLFRVVVPLTLPGMISVAIYSFIMSWNDFIYAFQLTTQDHLRTLPVGISLTFIGEYRYDWSGMMALATLTTLPLIVLFIVLQRFMLAGLTAGAVKE